MGPKNILVFGAYGFIATYLVDALRREGHCVTAADISELAGSYFAARDVPYVQLDIAERDGFSRLPEARYDTVIHLAACQPANVSEEKYDPTDYVRTNVIGTLNILEYCRQKQVGQVIYAMSHRNTQGLWEPNRAIREQDGCGLKYTGEYAMFSISESAAQDCVQHYRAQHGLATTVFRLPPVYGYGPHTEIFKEGKPMKTGFQVFIDRAREGRPLEVWGDPDVGRDIIYVKDVVAALLSAIDRPHVTGLFNITSGVYLTLREQAEVIARTFWGGPGEPKIVYRPEIPNGMDAFLYDNSKARRELEWSPRFGFREMLLDYEQEAASQRHRHLVEKRKSLFNQP